MPILECSSSADARCFLSSHGQVLFPPYTMMELIRREEQRPKLEWTDSVHEAARAIMQTGDVPSRFATQVEEEGRNFIEVDVLPTFV